MAHEISHQWFGDSVTEKDWDDAWLSEGFATYFAALTTEFYDGRDAFASAMKRARTGILGMEKKTPNIAVIHDNLPEIQNGRAPVGIVYQKGGWTLHMLRGVIGTEKFWAGIREYYRRYRDSNASSDDLRQVMEEASGTDLNWFFRQWLRRAGSPAVEGGWKYNAATKKVEIELAQTQAGEAFRLPMEVSVGGKVEAHRDDGKDAEIRDRRGERAAVGGTGSERVGADGREVREKVSPDYRMAMVTGGLDWPLVVSTTGTWLPAATPAGTTAFTWYRPANPGVNPA